VPIECSGPLAKNEQHQPKELIMKERIVQTLQALKTAGRALKRVLMKGASKVATGAVGAAGAAGAIGATGALGATGVIVRYRGLWLTLGVAAASAWVLVKHPPVHNVSRGEVAVRTNQLTGVTAEFEEGSMWLLPGLHQVRELSLRDQVYRPQAAKAPFQSVEGLSFGIDLAVRYAVDRAKVAAVSKNLPEDIGNQVVEPAVQGVIYKVLTRYTVREIFSTKRAEIQTAIETELRGKLAADGLVVKAVQIGKVELPEEYRRGMDRLLTEELETAKMRYTLELKDKRVRETELDALADKVKRETAAAAAGAEQVIAARAQEEAMRHVLPFKTKQIEQRSLEAEAAKVARVRQAEGEAQARQIEATGEAESRRKLADAEAYRLDRVGKIQSAQMERDGVLITRHPLLIQKTLADKLSDKIQVIIAPAGTDGRLITAGLVGGNLRGGSNSSNNGKGHGTPANAETDADSSEGAPQ
jgi:regulator of protease activity HflC (stomatin/prohibitin superfamily)